MRSPSLVLAAVAALLTWATPTVAAERHRWSEAAHAVLRAPGAQEALPAEVEAELEQVWRRLCEQVVEEAVGPGKRVEASVRLAGRGPEAVVVFGCGSWALEPAPNGVDSEAWGVELRVVHSLRRSGRRLDLEAAFPFTATDPISRACTLHDRPAVLQEGRLAGPTWRDPAGREQPVTVLTQGLLWGHEGDHFLKAYRSRGRVGRAEPASCQDLAEALHWAAEHHGFYEFPWVTAPPAPLLDANVLFAGAPAGQLDAPDLVRLGVERAGVVADGVSRVLLRLRLREPGRLACRVVGGDANGRVFPALEARTYAVDGVDHGLLYYDPPAAFGAPEDRRHGVDVRSVEVVVELTPDRDPRERLEVRHSVALFRPPVVLVHGTYDAPGSCWQTAASAEDFVSRPASGPLTSLHARLTAAGHRVFLVDFEWSNGATGSLAGLINSTFEHNQDVVWDGGDGEGIEAALRTFRDPAGLNLAATQVDVVCHSLGGLLVRVHASDAYRGGYRRADNFGAGDVHRLVTIATPHHGSDLPRILQAFKDLRWHGRLTVTEHLIAEGGFVGADWAKGFSTGAARDQIPESRALRAIGPTRIPAHALVCITRGNDLGDFGGGLRAGLRKLAEVLFEYPAVLTHTFAEMGQDADAERLRVLIDAGASDPDLRASLLRAAIFGNTQNDTTVRVESQQGGLPARYTSRLNGVLHSFATRYPEVQAEVVSLLQGPQERFAPEGFPAAGQPLRNVRPGRGER